MAQDDDAIRDLMAKLIDAVETSIAASSAVREALAELVRNGYEARLFFVANAESTDEANPDAEPEDETAADTEPGEIVVEPEGGAVREPGELRFELTTLDRDFLKSLHIRPEAP